MRAERDYQRLKSALLNRRKPLLVGSALATIVIAVSYAAGTEPSRILVRTEGVPDFKHASILGNPGEKVLQGEQTLFSKQQRTILDTQKQLQEEVTKLRGQLSQLQAGQIPGPSGTPLGTVTSQATVFGPPTPIASPSPAPTGAPLISGSSPQNIASADSGIRLGPAAYDPTSQQARDTVSSVAAAPQRPPSQAASSYKGTEFGLSAVDKSRKTGKAGSNVISFPVKTSGAVYLKRPSVVLPSGSYVKAKLLTGVEAPEGKTYPALLQLDFAYVIPNHKRLDLTGCFAIAKAQGDLSTERVQMQAVKLSCVSKKGGFFEREVNGFVADDTDNSFAIMGSVNTKQDRVAAMAFLSSVVTGVSKAVQQAQTTQQSTPLGGGQSIVTGDQAKYIGAGGAAEAATMVTQWYLKQAQNLLPTINVGSGQDVWVIMQDSVDLPKDYFAQNGEEGVERASIYSHFTRILE